jgi:hypothetical protein
MQLSKSVLDVCKIKLPAISKCAEALRICQGGELLLLPEAKVSDEARSFREKIFSVIDGKSAFQLMGEFKQVKEDEPEHLVPKVGRLKGQGGRRPLSISEQADILKEQAANDWEEIEVRLGNYADKFTMLTDMDAEIQIGILDRALKARSAWLKQPRNNRDPKAIQEMFHGKHR